jgi:flagellar protein FlaF
MYKGARETYEMGAKATDSGRALEAGALLKAARLLEACRDGWNAPDRAARLDAALRRNQRLWTIFQAELAEPSHELAGELRAKLLQLSGFIDRRTFEIMADPDPRKLQILIDINRHVAAGLSESTG